MKILLIDDDPFILKLLALQMEHLGFREVITCPRAQQALQLLAAGTEIIELIFCDLQMPEMDGVEVVRNLVQVGYQGGLVLVSGEDERILHTVEKLAKAHHLRVLGGLQKPVALEQLKRMIELNGINFTEAPGKTRRSYNADELSRAITGGELLNHYQPQIDLLTGQITGVESLVRWQHPQHGMVFPDQFITTAEEEGLIDNLTQTVLSNALQDARRWLDQGQELKVAINVSMDNLAALEFPDYVVEEATRAGISQKNLILEVTESKLMKDPLAVLDILTRLRLKHIGLSIDDFGTGHSSLAQLRDIPFDELKIDRGFIHGMSQDASIRAIFEASLGMAHQLGMKTVAEGVEDLADLEFLRATGCDLAQGYFIAKPMPAENLLEWLDNWKIRWQTL
ncbi:MAG: EAL domain-containing response regulator [Gammaproteobacteria bacterium]|nr:EAL domain-containing response regulator [Gammaproteobacteria bacterium]